MDKKKLLGQGSFSKVYLGYNKNNLNEKVAIKEIDLVKQNFQSFM
jgi:serine/threonine protein kinase